ncbi:MAG: nucleotidyltransferase family protein [Kiritimatiellae bacterium]|nr:nucleotidyltransferase family protein [Kiritimatiellia bacterium]
MPLSAIFLQDLLLRLCSAAGENGEPEAAVRVLGTLGEDWRGLARAIEREGLAPLAYHVTRRLLPVDGAPEGLTGFLRAAYHAALARNTLFLRVLDAVSDRLAGIPHIVLKGAYLATRVYDNPALRGFADIDLLVRKTDFAGADSRLNEAGYTRAEQGAVEGTAAFLNSVRYTASSGGPSVHVHWHLLNSILPKYRAAHMDIDEVWQRARPMSPDRADQLALAPEHVIIHLADHALRHSFDRLSLVCDMERVVVALGPELDWSCLTADSLRWGLGRQVYHGLSMLCRTTACRVPPDCLEALRPKRMGFAERLFVRLALKGRRGGELSNLVYVDAMPTLGGKCAFLWRALFPPRRVLAMAYGRPPEQIGLGDYLRRIVRGARGTCRLVRRGK